MKKSKLVALVLASVVAFSVAGCTPKMGSQESTPGQNYGMYPAPNDPATASSTEPGEDVKEEEETSDEPISLNMGESLFVIDSEGKLIDEYDLNAVQEQFQKQGVNLDYYHFRFYDNGLLYYLTYDDGDNGHYNTIYAVDPKADKFTVVYEGEKKTTLSWLDVYKGKVYFQASADGEDAYKGYCIDILEGDMNYGEAKPFLEDYYKVSYEYNTKYNNRNAYNRDCIQKIFDEVGFVLGARDDQFYRLDQNGKAEAISNASAKNKNCYFYDNNHIIFTEHGDDDYRSIGVYAMDLETGRVDTVTEEKNYALIAFKNDKLYYKVVYEKEYCINEESLYEFDAETGSNRLILTRKTVPGTLSASAIDNDLVVSGGKLYIPTFEGAEYVWASMDIDGGSEPVSLGYVAKTYDLFSVGTVEYASITKTCPDCGTPLEKYYGEKFVLDSKYSEHADEINKYFADMVDTNINDKEESNEYFIESTCDEHQEYPEMYCETNDDHVSRAFIIEDRYLAVEYSGYWYSGGAHGYPDLGEYLFDLTTGQRVLFKDFYKGSEEDFKDLIARKIKEDYNNCHDEYKYFAQDADDAYSQAYESANLDGCVEFEKDGITYNFFPYDLGPYASGFITVQASYDEVFGRSTLTE